MGILALLSCAQDAETSRGSAADLILERGKVVTLDGSNRIVSAIAIKGDLIVAAGSDGEVARLRGPGTRVINLEDRTVVPGLNDSHTHAIRGGLNWNLELRWDGVPTLAQALDMVRRQAERTPPGQWVRVVSGWSEFQFAERRAPTLEELTLAAPNTPVFVMYFYGQAFLNRAGLEALHFDSKTPDPPGGSIARDERGNPTGLLAATPNPFILYSTLDRLPKLSREEQINSTRQLMREFNRLGMTSVIDAGGGGQHYPQSYGVASDLARRGELTLRVAYYTFAQKPGQELADYARWVAQTRPGENLTPWPDGFVMVGAGENVLWAAADYENFLQPRPELDPSMEGKLNELVRLFVKNRWPFRIHATYEESISRMLDVIEGVNRELPLAGLRFIIDHAETISDQSMKRIHALGGGIAVQCRMGYMGELFQARYGKDAASHAPPVKRMIALGIPVGLGTDGTRGASYNLWNSLYWLVSGKTSGGTVLYPPEARLDRSTALRLATRGSAWFSGEEAVKGSLEPGKYADLAILRADYLSIPEEEVKGLDSLLTIVGGRIVYAAGPYRSLGPAPIPVDPSWSPVRVYGKTLKN